MVSRIPGASPIFFFLLCITFAPVSVDAQPPDGIDNTSRYDIDASEFAHVMDITIAGDKAYASIGLGDGFQVYNIANPTHIVRQSAEGNSAWRAWIDGDTAYSFTHEDGVELFDISVLPSLFVDGYNPSDPDHHYEGGVRVGDTLYVAAHQIGIDLLDLTSPNPISYVSNLSLGNNAAWNVAASAGHLYVANGRFGLSVVSLAAAPAEIATLSLPGLANDIVISGNTAFLSLAADGIASVDIGDPANPILLDTAPTMGNAFGLGLHGDMLVVGAYAYLERFDVSDPSNITLAGWDATKTYAMGADIAQISAGDTVIAVADWEGIATYKAKPEPAGDIDVYPVRLDFGQVDLSFGLKDTTVVVRNNGAGVLQVDSALTPAGIEVSPETFSLQPGESRLVTVSATTPNALRNKIRWYSDDPNESVFTQFVYKSNTTFPQVGSAAPFFDLLGTDGQQHRLTDYLGKVIFLEFGANW